MVGACMKKNNCTGLGLRQNPLHSVRGAGRPVFVRVNFLLLPPTMKSFSEPFL
jgi:hypothetical protein